MGGAQQSHHDDGVERSSLIDRQCCFHSADIRRKRDLLRIMASSSKKILWRKSQYAYKLRPYAHAYRSHLLYHAIPASGYSIKESKYCLYRLIKSKICNTIPYLLLLHFGIASLAIFWSCFWRGKFFGFQFGRADGWTV